MPCHEKRALVQRYNPPVSCSARLTLDLIDGLFGFSRVLSFVSHTWVRDRRDPMFRNSAEFTGFKAVELNNFLEDISSEKRASRSESGDFSKLDEMLMKIPTEPLVLWIDKVCSERR